MSVRSEHRPFLQTASPAALRLLRLSGYSVPDVHWQLRRALRGMRTVLDVGCGGVISPFRFIGTVGPQRRTGIDVHEPSIESSRRAGIHHEYLLGDVMHMILPEKSYDCVVTLDVVEH
jgi:2-polyprenyl-3-methyl-5-hydroxy-6-metoxy-1,4-benzoquinol methylase